MIIFYKTLIWRFKTLFSGTAIKFCWFWLSNVMNVFFHTPTLLVINFINLFQFLNPVFKIWTKFFNSKVEGYTNMVLNPTLLIAFIRCYGVKFLDKILGALPFSVLMRHSLAKSFTDSPCVRKNLFAIGWPSARGKNWIFSLKLVIVVIRINSGLQRNISAYYVKKRSWPLPLEENLSSLSFTCRAGSAAKMTSVRDYQNNIWWSECEQSVIYIRGAAAVIVEQQIAAAG
jgi:hypothetical protein